MKLTEDIINKLKKYNLWENEKEANNLLSYYVPMESKMYHSHKTPSKFKNTHLLQESANRKLQTGKYCEYPFDSRKYNEWALEEIRRCKEGYTINKGTKYELSITGYHYFFLNYKEIMVKSSKASKGRDWQFPRFEAIQYNFFWAYQECVEDNYHLTVLKSRGFGWSEIMSSIASCNYVLYKDKNFLFASEEAKLLGDGVFTKVNDNINFLNRETDGLFFHNRLTDKTLHKAAGNKIANGKDIRTGGEIIGKVIDNPRKARGSRGMLIGFEEGGSFPNLIKAVNTARPSVEEADNTIFGVIVVWGTGGDSNAEYLEGLKTMFYTPKAFNCKVFKNKWSKDFYDVDCGFFTPAYYYAPKFTDKDGNVDTFEAFLNIMRDRFTTRRNSADDSLVNQRAEEYPITPEEALQRKGKHKFPVKELEEQLLFLQTNPEIGRMWNNGWLYRNQEGKIVFRHDEKAVPLNDYPIKPDSTGKLKGCISIFQHPRKLPDTDRVAPIYSISVDGYSEDTSDYSDSVGAVYVMKQYSRLVSKDNLSGNIVAKYVGRMDSTKDFARVVFELAEYYNCIGEVHFERRGGGKIILDYAKDPRRFKLQNYLALSLSVLDPSVKNKNKQTYGNNFTSEENNRGLEYLKDWLLEEIELYDSEQKKHIYKCRLYTIYDVGLLKELINFVEDRNYDRISAMRQLMFVLQEEQEKLDNYQAPVINPYKLLKTNEWFK